MVAFKYILLQWFLRPPGVVFVLLGLGYLAHRKEKKWGKYLIGIALALLYVLSLTPVSVALAKSLTVDGPETAEEVLASKAEAIVVFGAGVTKFEGEVLVSTGSARRCSRAAYLHRLTGLPILVSSGNSIEDVVDSEAMAEILLAKYRISNVWLESESQDTIQNAQKSAAILKEKGLSRVFLVTVSTHSRRAKASLENYGVEVVSAPLDSYKYNLWCQGIAAFTPRAEAMELAGHCLQEWLANLIYQLRY